MDGYRFNSKREFGIIFIIVLITSLLLIYANNPSTNRGKLENYGPVVVVSAQPEGIISNGNSSLMVQITIRTNCNCVILNASSHIRFANRTNDVYFEIIDNPKISHGDNDIKLYFNSKTTMFELTDYIITIQWDVLETDKEFDLGDPRLLDLTLRLQDIRIDL